MEGQREAAAGGVVIWVDFENRIASYTPPESESRIDWMALAHGAEEQAQIAKTKRQREMLIRCALAYRAKARVAGSGPDYVSGLPVDRIRLDTLEDYGV